MEVDRRWGRERKDMSGEDRRDCRIKEKDDSKQEAADLKRRDKGRRRSRK